VQNRHKAIQKIEKDMRDLAELFQELEAAVIQQEPAVTQIEQRGEEVNEHVAKANTELTGAVDKARAARRKKFWCLGIVGRFCNFSCWTKSLTSSQSSSSSSSLLSWPL
jgi:syntaxin 1B/2/3